ncbi:aldo/keto reductase, partial [Salmonella enterica]|nr:aldo/keto reductase [Salmonella enterica]
MLARGRHAERDVLEHLDQHAAEAEGHQQLDYAFSRGINFIDTAEMYPVKPRAETYGRTEQIVGSWLKRQPRDRIVLATKVAGPARMP